MVLKHIYIPIARKESSKTFQNNDAKIINIQALLITFKTEFSFIPLKKYKYNNEPFEIPIKLVVNYNSALGNFCLDL